MAQSDEYDHLEEMGNNGNILEKASTTMKDLFTTGPMTVLTGLFLIVMTKIISLMQTDATETGNGKNETW